MSLHDADKESLEDGWLILSEATSNVILLFCACAVTIEQTSLKLLCDNTVPFLPSPSLDSLLKFQTLSNIPSQSALVALEACDVNQIHESLLSGAASGTGDGGALRTSDHVRGVLGEVAALHDGDGNDEVLEVDEGELAVD